MPTLYDVAHFCSWNGFAQDICGYYGVDSASLTNKEFLFPYGTNVVYGKQKKTRIQSICENMYIDESYNPAVRICQLLADGAKPDIKDVNGESALFVCCRNGWSGHLEIIKILLDAGADINQNSNAIGCTPLYAAARNGNIDIVKELIRRGADVNLPNNYEMTPICSAVYHGHLNVMKELIAAGAVITGDAFIDAIKNGQPASLKYLLRQGYTIPPNAIDTAVYKQRPGLIRMLAKAGADMNVDFPIHNAIRLNHMDCLLELCKNGSNVNLIDDRGYLPLKYAMILGQDKAVKILCDYKANVNAMTDGAPILHYPIAMYNRFPEERVEIMACLMIMLEACDDFNRVDEYGYTAADYADARGMSDIVILIKRAELKHNTNMIKKKYGASRK